MPPPRPSSLCLILIGVGALLAVVLASIAGHFVATGISYLAQEALGAPASETAEEPPQDLPAE